MLSLRIESRKEGSEIKSIAAGKYNGKQVFYNSKQENTLPEKVRLLMKSNENYMLENRKDRLAMSVSID